MSKTINEALKDLFIGLGGDPSQLADNSTVSDYIADLESAIKAAATAELPTPVEANVGKVATVVQRGSAYAWGADNIPAELPTPGAANVGKIATVVESEGVYSWGVTNIPEELPEVEATDNGKILAVVNGAWALVTVSAVADLTTGAVTFTFTPDTPAQP